MNDRYIVFHLDTESSGYTFRAGKYATVTLPGESSVSGKLSRIFSISSSPNNRRTLRFATLYRNNSEFKRRLAEMNRGDEVEVSPPSGGFFLISDRERPIVFMTSEIGITPVMSILNWAYEERLNQRMHLVYVNQEPGDALFDDEIRRLDSDSPHITVRHETAGHGFDSPSSMITGTYVRTKIPDLDISRAMFYVSGKPIFVRGVKRTLTETGIGAGSIKSESFSGY